MYQGQFQHPFITKRKTGKIECYGDNDPIACQPSRGAKSGAIIAMQCSSARVVFYSCIIDEAINDHDHSCLQRRQTKAQAKQASEGHCVLTTLHCLVMKVELTSCGIANFCRVTSSIPYKATFCQLDTKVSIRLSSYIWTGFSSPQQELTLLTKIFCVWRCYNDVQFVL